MYIYNIYIHIMYCHILHDVHDVNVVILLYIDTNALAGIVTGDELPKLDTPRLKSAQTWLGNSLYMEVEMLGNHI